MDVFLTSDGLLALVTLAALEIVLGVDTSFSLRSSAATPVSRTPSMAYFERRILTFIGYARGGDHELNGIAGRTPGQPTTSWRQAVGRDEAEG